MNQTLCPYKRTASNDHVCPYKKNFSKFYRGLKAKTSCGQQDQKDYQNFHNGLGVGNKLKLYYTSTCPMVSSGWWKKSKSQRMVSINHFMKTLIF